MWVIPKAILARKQSKLLSPEDGVRLREGKNSYSHTAHNHLQSSHENPLHFIFPWEERYVSDPPR